MHDESLIDRVHSWVKGNDFTLYKFSLVCSKNALKMRLKSDITNGVRKDDIVERSLATLPNFLKMDTTKIDVSDITPEQAAHIIYDFVYF